MTTIRKIVRLTDPEFFCNKSWTLSYSFITQSWLSFHSYIPNWYIGENNFFYSGKASCCDLFDFLAGELVSNPVTTTTTSTFPKPGPTTTSTTTLIDCGLIGTTTETDCKIGGFGVVVVPPVNPPCSIPPNAVFITLYGGYTTVIPPSVTDSTGSFLDACNAKTFLFNSSNPINNGIIAFGATSTDISIIGNNVFVFVDDDVTTCTPFPNGFYFTDDSNGSIYEIENGVVKSITPCAVPTTTTTTTIPMYLYTYEFYNCGSCSLLVGGTLGNSQPLTVGKFYFDPVSGFKVKIVTSLGTGSGTDRNILDSTKKDSCPEIICPPSTTTTTTLI